jgi:protein arginine N-methyltransferase 1
MNDAAARHLQPGGVLIPSGIEQFVCPVVAPRHYDELCAWDGVAREIDFTPARRMSLNNAYVRTFKPVELLGNAAEAACWDRIDFRARNRTQRRGRASWGIKQRRAVYGLALWWDAQLAEGIVLSTSPRAPATHWEQLFMPVAEPLQLGPGDELSVDHRSRSSEEGGTDLAWTFVVKDASGYERARQSLSLEQGFLP